ncbi:MAG TPA: A/G-specific adenine glycosylase [Acidimicrobiales bacterium]|nr:A/G-specific adenine glycosylase [Acidimicrobiales bacterium]
MGAPALSPLLTWWEAQRRDLPWRATRDPWAVLVCEVMAQQTQVARVAERWAPFLEEFPDPAAVARAPVAALVQAWSGLGYNRRAVNLHRCAVAVVEHHDGRLPASLPDLLALPGIGPYTARAVLAFAFEVDAAIVDTNTARVLARWAGHRLTATAAQAAADRALVPGRAWAWNQAMLDLGAGVCTRRTPRCADCPVRDRCTWHQRGLTEPDPADGSAGVSGGQAPFAGSDRQGRGRLVEALRSRRVPSSELAEVMGWPTEPARAERMAAGLVGEGLIRFDGDAYGLP